MTLATGGLVSDITIGSTVYRVHTFNSSGALTVSEGGLIEYLVIAGGGGGGGGIGGGGGAGGFSTGTVTIGVGQFTCTVGAGGSGRSGAVTGDRGQDSSISGPSFSTVLSYGGGGGGFYTVSSGIGPGLGGGSGGGAPGTGNGQGQPVARGVYPGSTYISAPRQGYDGGAGHSQDSAGAAGGGGGAGAVGVNGTANVGGAGGAGLSNSITGVPVTYAGGGGGFGTTIGSGGTGGGGAAGGTGTSGATNSGSGGGGASSTGGNGGSGVIIVRYILPAQSTVITATGGTTQDVFIGTSTYRIHTFTSSGVFNVTVGGSFDYFIVAGGGGGGQGRTGNHNAGGGGAGGVLEASGLNLVPGSYTVTIGGGGSSQTQGQNTTFSGGGISTITAIGGGAGGGDGTSPTPGFNGGSGGGGAGSGTAGTARAGGVGVYPGSTYINAARQGYDGGVGKGTSWGGGGGGAGATPSPAGDTGPSGNGGSGLSTQITGTQTFYGGGGGGAGTPGTGGIGGGGTGGAGSAPTAGTANTGGGGGGGTATGSTPGATGGSGIFIIRYSLTPTVQTFPAGVIATGGRESTILDANTYYRVHLFTSTQLLNVITTQTVEYLIVGGGGGGGSDMGGGGGAGGVVSGSISMSPGTYVVGIGAGGSGAPSGTDQPRAAAGNSSGIVPVGYKGNSYSFDGEGDGVNCGTQSAYAIGAAAFCLEGWIYNHRLKNFSTLWTTRPNNSTYADAYHIGWDANGGISLFVGSTSFAGGAAGSIKAGQWQHVAVTRNGSGNLALFVDGVRVGSATGFVTNFTRSLLGLGDFPTTKAEGIDGYISNARIVVGNFVYDPTLTTCTVPTQPLTAITGTVILTAQDLAFLDNSANNFSLIPEDRVVVSHFSPFNVLEAAGGGGGASDHVSAVANSRASGGGSGGGASGNNANQNNGIPGQGFNGGTTAGQWYPGGGGGAASAGTTNPANGGAGRANSILGVSYFWGGGGGGAGYTGNPGNGGVGGGGGGAPRQSATAGVAGTGGYNPGSDGTNGSLSAQTNVPGGDAGRNTGSGGGGGAHFNSNNFGGNGGSGIVVLRYPISVPGSGDGGQGGPFAGGGGGAGRNGYVGARALYKAHIFNSSGIFTITTGSGIVDYLVVAGGGGGGSNMGGGGGAGGFINTTTTLSTGSYAIVIGAGGAGAPPGETSVRGFNGGDSYFLSTATTSTFVFSTYFDGTGDTLAVPNTNIALGSGNWTIEFFCYPVNLSGQFYGICGQGDFQYVAIQFNETAASGRLTVWIDTTGASGWEFSFTSNRVFAPNRWYHIAIVKSVTTVSMFIDGVLDTTGSFSGTPIVAAGSFFIGRSQLSTRFFQGFISNFRITSGVAVYTGAFTVPTSPLGILQDGGTNISPITTNTNVRLLICNTINLADTSAFSATNTATITGNVASSAFSPFNLFTAVGGGGGASNYLNNNSPGAFGGSGGGVAGASNTINGLGIPGQGFAGGTSGGSFYPAGGGGAGEAGRNTPANGGTGRSSNILGRTFFWAGGGGGAGYTGVSGNGGTGGGGGGAPKAGTGGFGASAGENLSYRRGFDGEVGLLNTISNKQGGAGGSNTGGGGGGGSHQAGFNSGGAGGSGFIAIRYRASEITAVGGTVLDVFVNDTALIFSGVDIFNGGVGAPGTSIASGTRGTLGGGGGGGSSATVAGGGGGINFNGAFVNGEAGSPGQNGGGGSNTATAVVVGNGGLFGGGGGGTTNSVVDPSVGNGARGALKIFWQGTQLRYPEPVLAATNISNLIASSMQTELLETTTTGTDLTSITGVFVPESVNIPNYFTNNAQGFISVTTVKVGTVSPASNNLSINEWKILVQSSDFEAMLVNNYDAELATVQDQTKYQIIDQVTLKNDPRRVTVRVLNFVVGVTGEGPLQPTQIQTWF